jgi:hypothetical protein
MKPPLHACALASLLACAGGPPPHSLQPGPAPAPARACFSALLEHDDRAERVYAEEMSDCTTKTEQAIDAELQTRRSRHAQLQAEADQVRARLEGIDERRKALRMEHGIFSLSYEDMLSGVEERLADERLSPADRQHLLDMRARALHGLELDRAAEAESLQEEERLAGLAAQLMELRFSAPPSVIQPCAPCAPGTRVSLR